MEMNCVSVEVEGRWFRCRQVMKHNTKISLKFFINASVNQGAIMVPYNALWQSVSLSIILHLMSLFQVCGMSLLRGLWLTIQHLGLSHEVDGKHWKINVAREITSLDNQRRKNFHQMKKNSHQIRKHCYQMTTKFHQMTKILIRWQESFIRWQKIFIRWQESFIRWHKTFTR